MTLSPSIFVSYLRVSTQRQGASGLGLEAQREALQRFVEQHHGIVLAEYVEIETGKGANALSVRPQLRSALHFARINRATLLIAKLDRLARNVHFVSGLIESGVSFIACDMPEANKVMLQIHAVMAEHERDQIAQRTRAALCAAKARGVRLGTTAIANAASHNAERRTAAETRAVELASQLVRLRDEGHSLREIGSRLTATGHHPLNGGKWHPAQVARALLRVGAVRLGNPERLEGSS